MSGGDLRDSIWRSGVNSFLAIALIGTCLLGATLIIWQTAFSENPIANAMATELVPATLSQ
jgi:hypothetical protein